MTVFAIVKDEMIEDIAIADEIVIMQLLIRDRQIIPETLDTGFAWVGSEIINGKFKPPQPHKSWSFDNDIFDWVPPIAQPNYPSYWDEESLSWLRIPTESVEE